MMYTKEELEEQYNKIPADLQQAVSSTDVDQKMQDIINKYKLQLDEGNEVFEETGLVMLGFTHPNDYVSNLKKRLTIPEEIINNIAKDINEQIFVQIRESLKLIHKEQAEDSNSENVNKEATEPLRPEINNKLFVEEKETTLAESSGESKTASAESSQPTQNASVWQDGELKTEEENPERARILKEIEQPSSRTQSINKISTEKVMGIQIPTKTVNTETMPHEKELLGAENKSLTEEKLEKPLIIPQEKVVITEKIQVPTNSEPKIDPYREPIE